MKMWESGKDYQFDIGWRDIDTVLVLGAGASCHLGYPLGMTLSENILANTKDPSAQAFKLLESMGFTQAEIIAFHQEFRKSVSPTIDEFLSRRGEFVRIGRATIAQELIKYEQAEALQQLRDNWYLLLREKIISAIEQNQYGPTIITFNYDRSIGRFVTDLINSNFPRRTSSLRDTVSILHVHGRLGYLDDDVTPGFKRPYSNSATPEEILQSSEGIRVISELENDYGKEMQVAQAAVARANKVFFLGFGYDATNLDRLRITRSHKGDPWQGENKYYGTAFKLASKQVDQLRKESQNRLILGRADLAIEGFLNEQSW